MHPSIVQHLLGIAKTWPILVTQKGDHEDVPGVILWIQTTLQTFTGNEGLLLKADAFSSIGVAKGV